MADPTITVTILDMPEIQELLREAIEAVPEWERDQFRERMAVLMERAVAAQQAIPKRSHGA